MKECITLSVLMICATAVIVSGILTGQVRIKDEADQSKEALYTFGDLLDAIWFVESECGLNSKPGLNGEIGDYQLKKIYVDDCNRILDLQGMPTRVTYDDRNSPRISRAITCLVTQHYANNDWGDKPFDIMGYIETAARSHHRAGDRNNSKTDAYWEKVKARMESVK